MSRKFTNSLCLTAKRVLPPDKPTEHHSAVLLSQITLTAGEEGRDGGREDKKQKGLETQGHKVQSMQQFDV